jgi:hypothetical protein
MACSSPREIFFLGDQQSATIAASRFFSALALLAGERMDSQEGNLIDKMMTVVLAAANAQVRSSWIANQVVYSWLGDASVEVNGPGGGFFTCSVISELDQLPKKLKKSTQTVSYFGFEQETLREWIRACSVSGVDRIVPIGRALDFGYVWDGMDLPIEFLKFTKVV